MAAVSVTARWVDGLQRKGYYTFTREQAQAGTERSFVATQTALRRLKEQGRIVCPHRGFYVIVPVEYRETGSPPASWFVEDLMRHLGQPYYVGLLSAAAIHGAAHQQPMVFQVMTDRPTHEMSAGKIVLRFTMDRQLEGRPVQQKQTETGTMQVATPETTAFDLVRFPAEAGHWSGVAMVLSELSERLAPRRLVKVASLVRVPDVQRLGYLLDALGHEELTGALAEWLEKRRPRALPLQPRGGTKGELDRRWNVWPNMELEVDL